MTVCILGMVGSVGGEENVPKNRIWPTTRIIIHVSE